MIFIIDSNMMFVNDNIQQNPGCYLVRAFLRSSALSKYFLICEIFGDNISGNFLRVIISTDLADKEENTEKC